MMMRFLDMEGRVKAWPARREMKRRILEYLATKFQVGQMYSEKEVNDVLRKWHTFEDYFLLRRGLVDERLLLRTRNGAMYWRPDHILYDSGDPVDSNTRDNKDPVDPILYDSGDPEVDPNDQNTDTQG